MGLWDRRLPFGGRWGVVPGAVYRQPDGLELRIGLERPDGSPLVKPWQVRAALQVVRVGWNVRELLFGRWVAR